MEREQIIKALECCFVNTNCNGCPLDRKTDDCLHLLGASAMACIKELSEENERLRAEVNKLDALSDEMGVDLDVKLKTIFELEDKLKAEKADVMYFKDQIRADTVRKMQSEIIKRCIKGGIYPAFVASAIDKIAKEMLEGL